MDGDNKKSGFRKRTKPKDGGFDSDVDEPIGSLLKLKRSRNSKKTKLNVDDGGGRDKMVDKKGAKLPVQEDFGGMDDTLASFRKKLKRPKKVSGTGIAREQSSALSVTESLNPLFNTSKGHGDLDTRLRPENGELMDREDSDSSAKIDAEMRCEAPDLESKDMVMGISSRRSANCSLDKQLDDSLSAFVQKVQSGSTRKSVVSTTFRPDCKDEASEDKLSPFCRAVSEDHEAHSIVSINSSSKLAQVVKKPDSELTTSYLISCSHCTKENCNPGRGQCHQGIKHDQEEDPCSLNGHENPDMRPCISNEVADKDSKNFSQFRDNFRVLERKASCEIKNVLKHCSCGNTITNSHLAEMGSFQDGLGENQINENMCSSCRPLEKINENHDLCVGVSSRDFCDAVAQETTVNLSKTIPGVDCEGKERLLVKYHDELSKSTNFCESSSNPQLSAGFDSTKVDKTDSDSDNLNTGNDEPNDKGRSMQKENATISNRIDSTAVQSLTLQKLGPKYPDFCPGGNFSMISDSQPAKVPLEMDGPNNILTGKEVKVSSLGSFTPDDNDLEDVISAPESEKDLKLSALQRVARKTKKPRHEDMAYEGDIDWEVLISERAVDGDHSFRSRKDSTSTTFTEAETGGRAAVSAGLKAHAVGLLEKIKFKDVLKRKGGLQEYIACRNQILGLWCKDVTRILRLVDCGVTDTPSMDEPPRFSLVREIYAFLNLRGYINAGIASEKAKSESDIKYDYELGEKKVGDVSVASAADSEEGVSVMVKNSDASNAENDVSAGCEVILKDAEGRDPVIANNLDLPKPVELEQELVHDLEYCIPDPTQVKFVGDVPGKAASHLTNQSRNSWGPISSDECVGDDQQQQSNSEIKKKVIVIGAGPAGLTAAKHLLRQGFTVTVLEARNRLGGRVHTDRSSLSVPVDLGASIITGVEADVATERRPDPSSLICTQLGLELTVLNSDCPLYDIITCKKVPLDMDEALEAEYNSLLDDMVLLVAQRGEHAMAMSLEEGLEYALKRRRMARGMDVCSEEEVLSPFERRVMNWHFANLEYGCAAMLKKVSLPNWNQDDLYGGFGGAHCMIKGGYSTVVESLGGGLDVRLNHVVADISYSTSDIGFNGNQCAKVKVSTTNGCEFLGDAVLITVPLGCLKAETIKFSPPLPEWKRLSIQRLGFGVLNKIVIEFPEVFWDDSVDYFGATAEETKWRGQCFMFWNVRKTVGAPVLIALVVGQAAVERQYMSSSDNVSHALMVLRKLFGEAVVPDPVASVVTDWGRDPFSYGAYSYVAVGASGEDYDILAKPVGKCLFFAGEATCKEHPDTVGGAMMSGLREAVRMIDILSDGYDFTAEVEAMEAAQRQSECENDEVGDIITRLEAVKLSDALYKSSLDGARILTIEALLQDLFFSSKTTAGRLHVAKELLNLPAETLKSFAGTKEGLTVLNSWILDSMGKDGTQLLRQCVRILVVVSTDLLAVRLSGIGKTVKEKVCVHTSRDIRAIASQLVSIWLEVFRKEKAANGGLKLSKSVSAVELLKRKSNKDSSSGKPPLHANNSTLDSRGNLLTAASAAMPLQSDVNMKNDNSKQLKFELENSSKSDISSSRSRGSFGKQDAEMEDNIAMTEEEEAAFAAAEAARAAALAAAKAYASAEAKSAMQLPKIPSFHKFARREHYAQMDECEYKKKLSGSVLGRQDCISEIDSRNCRVRNWSVEFSAACVNLESSRMSADNLSQRSHSNEIVSQLNFREHSGESAPVDSSIYTKAWVDTAGSVGMKDYHAIERWRTQAAAAHVNDEEDSNMKLDCSNLNSQITMAEETIPQLDPEVTNSGTEDMELETTEPKASTDASEANEAAPVINGDATSKREREESADDGVADGKKQKIEKSVEEERLEKLGGDGKCEEEPVPVSLGPKSFRSSVELFDYFYKILHHWPVNLNVNQYEQMVLVDLLKKGHLEPEKKIGCGIHSFQIRFHPEWKSKCFFLIREDESADDFSFRKCVDHILPLPENFKGKFDANRALGGGKHRGGGRGGGGGRGRGGGGRWRN